MSRIFSIILILSFAQALQASSSDSLFAEGNLFYQKGEYGSAIERFESILSKGESSASLYFNLGNAYFKAGVIPAAILNFERAKRLDPGNEDIRFNLDMANHRVVDKIEVLPEFFLYSWARSLREFLSIRQWAWLTLTSFSLFLAGLSLFLFTRQVGWKKFALPVFLLFFLTFILSFWMGWRQKQELNRSDEAIIFNPTITVKGSPDASSTDLFLLHEGTKVKVIDSLGTWREIRIADGNKGWVTVQHLRII